MAAADITIPTDLLPADGRFGCGPSKVGDAAVAALASDGAALLGTSHRKAPVKGLVQRLQEGIATLFDLPDGYEVLVANGGATAFWDMATFGLVQQRSHHDVFGEFSSKFAKSTRLAPFLDDPAVTEAEPGSRPDPTPTADGADVRAFTHNETSTGVMQDIARPDGDALVLVDATSGAGGLPVDVAQTDVYYFSLQKGFASDGGLVVALASPAAVERIGALAASDRYVPPFLDLQTVVDNSRKHQTYNTPAVATMFLAAEQVDAMNAAGGLDAAVAGTRAKSDHLYAWAEEREWAAPFVTDPAARSLVVGTVDLADELPVDDMQAALRANGVVDSDGYRKLGRNQVRVAMFPTITLDDVQAYTACVDHVAGQLLG